MVSLKKEMLLCCGTRHEAQAGHRKAQKDLGTATLVQATKENSLCGPESKKSPVLAPSCLTVAGGSRGLLFLNVHTQVSPSTQSC